MRTTFVLALIIVEAAAWTVLFRCPDTAPLLVCGAFPAIGYLLMRFLFKRDHSVSATVAWFYFLAAPAGTAAVIILAGN